MSSFVISKSEYMKAAGFCAALAEEKNYFGEPVLRIWDPERRRVAGADDFKRYFAYLYKLNNRSVAAQYGERVSSPDPGEYNEEFEAAKKFTRRAYKKTDTKQIKTLVFGFYKFCNASLYQIEEPRADRLASEFLHILIFNLFSLPAKWAGASFDDIDGFWGSFPYDDID